MSRDEQLTKAEALFKAAFSVPREPRSLEYQRGVMAALIFRSAGISIKENCPFKPGTVEMDAFLSGTDEGHRIWKAHTQEQPEPTKPPQSQGRKR